MNSNQEVIYWAPYSRGRSQFYLSASERGLCCITLPNESFIQLERQIIKRYPRARMVRSDDRLASYIRELDEYFHGIRTRFESPLNPGGTPFQQQVWNELRQIPYGQTRSYSELADAVRHPKAVRAVGAANANNPLPIFVPCHRVIGKNAKLVGYRGGIDLKSELLELERQTNGIRTSIRAE